MSQLSTDIQKLIKSWVQATAISSTSQGTALIAESTSNTVMARAKNLEDRFFALLQKKKQTEKTVQNLNTTLINLLSLQEMASVQASQTARTVDSFVVLQVTHTNNATITEEKKKESNMTRKR